MKEASQFIKIYTTNKSINLVLASVAIKSANGIDGLLGSPISAVNNRLASVRTNTSTIPDKNEIGNK